LSLTDGTDRLFKTLVTNYQHKTCNNSGQQSAQLCFGTSLKEIIDYLRRYAVLNLSGESLFVMLVLQTIFYAQFIRISIIYIHTTFETLSSIGLPVNIVQLQATWRFSYSCHRSSDGLLWHNVLTRFCEKSIKHETGKHTRVNRTCWFRKYVDFFFLAKGEYAYNKYIIITAEFKTFMYTWPTNCFHPYRMEEMYKGVLISS